MKNWYIVQSHSSFENKVASLIKEEADKAKIADKFEEIGGKIDLVFDDRNKVVDMWRARGTTVVQVADGDF